MANKGRMEHEIQNECLKVLDLFGIYHWRQNTGSFKVGKRFIRTSMPGVSDILGIMPDGRFLAIECKREKGGVVSDAQKKFLNAIAANNGLALVINDPTVLFELLKNELKLPGR